MITITLSKYFIFFAFFIVQNINGFPFRRTIFLFFIPLDPDLAGIIHNIFFLIVYRSQDKANTIIKVKY